MTEQDLLERLERHAVKIANLEAENARLSGLVRDLPKQAQEEIIRSMARTAVNCGKASSCAVAGWYLEGIEGKT